jgi:alanyl-tRNA synthetase
MTIELAKEKGIPVDKAAFEKEFEHHKELSRAGSGQRFKSGLADQSETTVALHTATHMLHAALRKVLGTEVQQKGSNITPERLRFDFAWPTKVAPEQLKRAEDLVNQQIERELAVTREELPLAEAKAKGALAFFSDKYTPEKVSMYTIGDFSKEVCTGPHVTTTKGMGHFKIQKEEAVSAGVRRIKAVLEKEN